MKEDGALKQGDIVARWGKMNRQAVGIDVLAALKGGKDLLDKKRF